MSNNESKRYYWLRLKDDFFDQKHVRALRKLPSGDSMTIVYLKMMLKSIKSDGKLMYERILPAYESELALALDEDENTVRLCVEALLSMGIVERLDGDDLYITSVSELLGSECDSAKRVRNFRDRIALQSNGDVTMSNAEIEIDKDKRDRKREHIKDFSADAVAPSQTQQIDYSEITNLFNTICVSFPRITKLSEARKKSIKARLNVYSIDDFKKMFIIAESSSFLKGSNNHNWRATFDWLINDGNFAKVLDGNYSDITSGQTGTVQHCKTDYSEAERYQNIKMEV